MADRLRQLLKVLNALVRLVPVLIDILQDLGDDGKRNHSTGGAANVRGDGSPT